MKILYFLDEASHLGGACKTLLLRACIMKKEGMHVLIVVNEDLTGVCPTIRNICDENAVELVSIGYTVASEPEDIDVIAINENDTEICDLIEKYQPDILHSVQINAVVELVARRYNIPHIMDIYPVKYDFFSIDYPDIFPHYHICDSRYYAQAWNLCLNTDYTCIRPYVYDAPEKTRVAQQKDKLGFICVGSVYEGKNQLKVIQAFERFRKSGKEGVLKIYGYCGGIYANLCKTYISDHGMDKDIYFMDFTEDMKTVYQQNDVLICGSKRESYPNVIAEAMAFGVVVISTPAGGIPELLEDKKNGYLCKGFEAADIYEKMLEIQADFSENRVQRLVEEAYRTYSDNHSYHVVKKQLEQYYQYVIDDNKNRNSKVPYQIEDLKIAFSREIAEYDKNIHSFCNPYISRKKIWLIHFCRDEIGKNAAGRKCYIWGTGKLSQAAFDNLKVFFQNIELTGFIDSYRSGKYLEYDILSPDQMEDGSYIMIATSNGQNDIIRYLQQQGKKYVKDYFILCRRWW